MKPYKGIIKNIRCGTSWHNHMIIIGQAVDHEVYAGTSMHTSGVEKITFYMNDVTAEIETHNSRYSIMGEDFVLLFNLDKSMFDDLTIEIK